MKKQLRGSFLLLMATVIWGAAFVAQSVGADHISPSAFQAIRCALAVIGLQPIIMIIDRLQPNGKSFFARWANKKLWIAGLLCGIPLFLATNLQQMGLVDTDAGKSGFLTAMYIVIVPVLGIFLKRKPTVMVPISVAIAVAGLYCLSCVGASGITLGDLLLIGCALMFAVQIIFVDLFAQGTDALRLNTIQTLVCVVLSTVLMICTNSVPTWNAVISCAGPLAYAGFLSMGIAYSLQIIGQQDLEPTPAALIMSLESVFAVRFGMMILGESMNGWEIIGCVLLFIAVILSQIPIKSKK